MALAAICSTPVPDGPEPGRQLQYALEHAVRAGGDTDTVAAIAGARRARRALIGAAVASAAAGVTFMVLVAVAIDAARHLIQ